MPFPPSVCVRGWEGETASDCLTCWDTSSRTRPSVWLVDRKGRGADARSDWTAGAKAQTHTRLMASGREEQGRGPELANHTPACRKLVWQRQSCFLANELQEQVEEVTFCRC